MGCDIHLYTERFVDGAWHVLVPPKRDLERWPMTPEELARGRDDYSSPFWGPFGCMYTDRCCDQEGIPCVDAKCPKCLGTGNRLHWYQKRNYAVFGVLAGVRGPDNSKPIRKPRGMPKDVSHVVRDHHSWDHTPSWLTVDEVMAYSWGASKNYSGLIPVFDNDASLNEEAFEAWIKRCAGRDRPKHHCGGMNGREVSVDEAKLLVTNNKRPKHPKSAPDYNNRLIVWVEWQECVHKKCLDFITFVTTFIEPLLGDEYAQIKSVTCDLLEQEHRRGAECEPLVDFQWLTVKTKDKRAIEWRAEAKKIAATVRFVFGFDS